MQTDDGENPLRPIVAPAVVPGPVTIVAVPARPATSDDLRAAAAVGVDAVSDGADVFAADPAVVRVAAPASDAAIGAVCVALHRGVRVVVCDCVAVEDCVGTVRAVRTYQALLDVATSADALPSPSGASSR